MWRTVIIRRGFFFKPLHNTHVRLDSKVCVYVFLKLHTNNRAIRPCHSSHPMPLALICTREINGIVCVCVCVCIYEIAHNRAIRPCHPSHSMPLALILPRGDQCVCVCVCVFIKLHIPTRSTIEGGGDVTNCPRFERGRHENSPYRGHI